MQGLNSEIADLIIADLPSNKEKRFNHLFGTETKTKPEFDDGRTRSKSGTRTSEKIAQRLVLPLLFNPQNALAGHDGLPHHDVHTNA